MNDSGVVASPIRNFTDAEPQLKPHTVRILVPNDAPSRHLLFSSTDQW